MGNINYMPYSEAQELMKTIAIELRKVAEEFDGVETDFGIRVAHRRLHQKVVFSDMKYGLTWGISEGYIKVEHFPDDEESSLLVGDMIEKEGWY